MANGEAPGPIPTPGADAWPRPWQSVGLVREDTVAIMAPNVPAIYEAHFGVPMTGAVLNTLNIRLDAEAIAFQLTHGEAKVLITDREFSPSSNARW